jgi:c-di-GMP-binding flagellar brake protein YcgR
MEDRTAPIMSHKFELLHSDEYSQYLLHDKPAVLFNLRALMKQRVMLSAFIDAGADSFLTAILAVTADEGHLILDAASDEAVNRRVDGAAQLICVSQLDRIKIQFAVRDLRRHAFEGHEAFRVPLPDVLLRQQRREYYRLTAPTQHGLACLIPVAQGAEARVKSVEAHVLDISGGGLAVLVPPSEMAFEADMEFPDCRLMLPETGPIATAIRVRNLFRITGRDGSVMLRAGCEFVGLPQSMAATIQRYILRAERERNAHDRLR